MASRITWGGESVLHPVSRRLVCSWWPNSIGYPEERYFMHCRFAENRLYCFWPGIRSQVQTRHPSPLSFDIATPVHKIKPRKGNLEQWHHPVKPHTNTRPLVWCRSCQDPGSNINMMFVMSLFFCRFMLPWRVFVHVGTTNCQLETKICEARCLWNSPTVPSRCLSGYRVINLLFYHFRKRGQKTGIEKGKLLAAIRCPLRTRVQ